MKNLAPIGISTYSRVNHLKQTVEALQKNTLAKESELYIFSDAPKKGDEEIVAKVRAYLHTIDGFKNVYILERETNSRIVNNRGGIQQLLDKYEKMIFMEDDIVTAPGFLQFMNDGLEFYKDDENILSIAGFTPQNHCITADIYFSDRFMGWGFGIWKDKYKLIKYLPCFDDIQQDKATCKNLNNMGDDMLSMIKLESEKKIDGLDIKACYLSAKSNLINVAPTITLVRNIGLDGSGVHCGNIDTYENLKLSEKVNFKFVKLIYINKKENRLCLNKNLKKHRKPLFFVRAVNKLSRIILKRNIIK